MFSKSHRPNPASNLWRESPLIILPDELLDMTNHYDPNEVKKDEFQIQVYGLNTRPTTFDYQDSYSPFATRGGGDTLAYESPLKGLGIGFGEASNRTAQTRATIVNSLLGSFKIVVVPQQ